MTNRASLEAALARIERRWETPFGLINNAALDSPPDAPAMRTGLRGLPGAAFDRIMDVNVKGVHLCCQVFGGAMAAGGRGSIVNIGSIYGVLSPDQGLYEYRAVGGESFYKPVAYSVSKSALYNLTRYLAVYWGRAGVRVNIADLRRGRSTTRTRGSSSATCPRCRSGAWPTAATTTAPSST